MATTPSMPETMDETHDIAMAAIRNFTAVLAGTLCALPSRIAENVT
jgi:hypothetical protein